VKCSAGKVEDWLLGSALAAFGTGIAWLVWGMGNWHGVQPGYYARAGDLTSYVWSQPVYPPGWYFIVLGVLLAWSLVGLLAAVLWEAR
jgi:hypothetical protein